MITSRLHQLVYYTIYHYIILYHRTAKKVTTTPDFYCILLLVWQKKTSNAKFSAEEDHQKNYTFSKTFVQSPNFAFITNLNFLPRCLP